MKYKIGDVVIIKENEGSYIKHQGIIMRASKNDTSVVGWVYEVKVFIRDQEKHIICFENNFLDE